MTDSVQHILGHWFDGHVPIDQSVDELSELLKQQGGRAALVDGAMMEMALRRAAKLPSGLSTTRIRTPGVRRLPPLVAIAAAIVVAGGLVWWFAHPHPTGAVTSGTVLVAGHPSDTIAEGQKFQIPAGASAKVRLSDGSGVTFDGGSTALLQLAPSKPRLVRLDAGAADFDVATAGQEFRVQTPIATVHVTGTQFRVALLPTALLHVSVSRGSVSVDFKNGQISLSAGGKQTFAILPDSRGGPAEDATLLSIDPATGAIDAATASRTFSFHTALITLDGQSATAASLKPGMQATLVLSPNQREVMELRARSHK